MAVEYGGRLWELKIGYEQIGAAAHNFDPKAQHLVGQRTRLI
jgi:hypothetical protein